MQKVSANSQLAPRRKRKSISYDKYGYLFVAPFFIVFLIFQLYPIFFTFRTSLTDAAGWNKILENDIIGFANFAKLFDFGSEVSRYFWQSIGNTVIMWLCNFIPQIGMALLLAIKSGLKAPLLALLGHEGLAGGVRYFLLVLVAGAVWPLVFRPMSKWGKGKK